MRVPSHTGIRGNEIADELAKMAHDSNLVTISVNLELSLSEIIDHHEALYGNMAKEL